MLTDNAPLTAAPDPLSADNGANAANNAPYPSVVGASMMDKTIYAAAVLPLPGVHGPSIAAYKRLSVDTAPLLATDAPFGAGKITSHQIAYPTKALDGTDRLPKSRSFATRLLGLAAAVVIAQSAPWFIPFPQK
jgi:hypothetical protein